jgi:mono/diheme cytochrome c family protein
VTAGHRILVVACLAALSAGCVPDPTPSPASTADPEAAALYDRFCATCHGQDGRSVVGPVVPHLNSQGLLATVDDAFLRESIALGRPGANGVAKPGTKMPIFAASEGGPLSDEDIERLVGHIRRWQTVPSVELAAEPTVVPGDPALGAELYQRHCTICHGPDGWGETAPRLAGSTFQAIASDALIRHTVLHGREGTTMEPIDLTEQEIGHVVAFVRTLGP